MSKQKQLEDLYLNAKKKYYSGNPIMSDAEFDDLEDVLRSFNSNVITIVGTDNKSDNKIKKPKSVSLFDFDDFDDTAADIKGKHTSKMLSLAKVKTDNDSNIPIEDAKRWFNKLKVNTLICEPKYDGNAVNLIYKEGKFTRALTRGDGIEGFDITDKVIHIPSIPKTINFTEQIVEVRGEILIRVSIFATKYNTYKNPRNFVAGVLNRDDIDSTILSDLTFIPFDLRSYNPKLTYIELQSLVSGTNKFILPQSIQVDIVNNHFDSSFTTVYNYFLNYRDNCEYQLDGFVIKTKADKRMEIGETSHHPDWALAVKFKSRAISTRINDIEWKIGKDGTLYPVGLLEPIDLDGSTVSRVSMYNYGWIKDNKCYPGAIVEIAKRGDIIPGIVKVIKESDIYY